MHLKTVGKYIRRSPYQSLAAVLIMILTMFMISIFSILTILSIRLIDYFEQSPQLTLFFKEEAKVDQIMNIKEQYESTGKISSIKYVSKEDALKIYNKLFEKENPILLDLVTSDVLPASIEIQAQKAEHLEELAGMVEGNELIDSIAYQKDIIDTFISWVNVFKTIGIAVIGVLVVTAILVILSIIAFKIVVRRDEIEIMKLIGATNWFVRTPFIFEGMFYGFVGAIVGWFLSLGILFYATPFIQSSLKGIPIFPIPTILLAEVLVGQIILACILGAFASFLAVLRYLK